MAEQFFIPTKVIAGKGCIREHASLLAALGAKAMVVTGCHSALVNGSQADITAALQEKRIPYFVYNRIASNPSIAAVREAAAVARDEGADFVIGCGGGSPLDAAKAIALLAANDLDDAELFAGIFENPALPMVAVPTTAGTGSEVTQYAILTNDRLQTKTSIASEAIFPRLAFLDATYTLSLPLRVTVNTALDALSHALEGCLAKRATALSNLLAAESLRISGCLPAAIAGGGDLLDRPRTAAVCFDAGGNGDRPHRNHGPACHGVFIDLFPGYRPRPR
jgi:alcohol dehydrogenase class IV